MAIRFALRAEVEELHRRALERFGGLDGIRDETALDAALGAAENAHLYGGGGEIEIAACYLVKLVKCHAFIDGNKRVGAATAGAFLVTNGFQPRRPGMPTDDDIYQLTMEVAEGRLKEEDVGSAFDEWYVQVIT